MKESRAGRDWVRQEWDPEYTRSRDLSPKRIILNKYHLSQRSRISLRALWDMREEEAMSALMDGCFLTDVCLGKDRRELDCEG